MRTVLGVVDQVFLLGVLLPAPVDQADVGMIGYLVLVPHLLLLDLLITILGTKIIFKSKLLH